MYIIFLLLLIPTTSATYNYTGSSRMSAALPEVGIKRSLHELR